MPLDAVNRIQPLSPRQNTALCRDHILLCSLHLERQLAALSTANKTRVLLAIHANIAEQLEALHTDNSN
jgi:hypothetical protein